ncbi:MAG: hypothetical protein JSS65_05510 [Armatimonadetes bacterium]|nr:hypothetical protein [Armatimonadota bacterium]
MAKSILVGLFLFTAGCTNQPGRAAATKSHEVPALPKYDVKYSYSGEIWRPEYIPDKKRLVQTVSVGRNLSGSVVEDGKGGSWSLQSYEDGIVRFTDGSSARLKSLTLVYDNGSGSLAAIESEDSR